MGQWKPIVLQVGDRGSLSVWSERGRRMRRVRFLFCCTLSCRRRQACEETSSGLPANSAVQIHAISKQRHASPGRSRLPGPSSLCLRTMLDGDRR